MSVGLERGARIRLAGGAIERVCSRPIATQQRLFHPVGVHEHCGLGITLFGANRYRLSDGLECQRRRNTMGYQELCGCGLLLAEHAAGHPDKSNRHEHGFLLHHSLLSFEPSASPSSRRVLLSYSREDIAALSRRIREISPEDR